MNKGYFAVGFVVGALSGSLITWRALKSKMEKEKEEIIQEELSSIRKTFDREEVIKELKKKVIKKPDISEYANKIRESQYEAVKEIVKEKIEPYIINPDRFSEFSDYATETLTFYADGVLTDETGDELSRSEIEDMIGLDALNHFGEGDNDDICIYVRNDVKRVDYEIIMDETNYFDEPRPERITLKEDE